MRIEKRPIAFVGELQKSLAFRPGSAQKGFFPGIFEAGANILVAGTSIYKPSSSVAENIKLLRESSQIHVQIK